MSGLVGECKNNEDKRRRDPDHLSRIWTNVTEYGGLIVQI